MFDGIFIQFRRANGIVRAFTGKVSEESIRRAAKKLYD